MSITLPAGGGHGAQTRCAQHHVAVLPADHCARDGRGYPVTSLARTAVDLVQDLELPQSLGVLDAAARRLCESYLSQLRRRDYRNQRLVEAARRELRAAASWVGRRSVLSAIAVLDPARESVAESLSAGHFRLAGLPDPACQPPIESASGVYFPDFYWAAARVIGECDGAVKYSDPSAYVREKEREQSLRDAGYLVVRWLAKEIMFRPEVVVARVARALSIHQ